MPNSVVITTSRKRDIGDIKAFFDVVVNNISIKGVKLIKSKKNDEMYVGFPSQKGQDGKYYSIVYIEDMTLRQELLDALLKAYKE